MAYYHVTEKINLDLPAIKYLNLNFEISLFKSWWYSNSNFIEWCYTLTNATLYSFFIISTFIFLSIANNSFFLDSLKKKFYFLIPFKIILESIFIYFVLKITVLKIAYPLASLFFSQESDSFFVILFLIYLLLLFLLFFFIILFLFKLFNKIYNIKYLLIINKL
tara:strand:+ start:837 stop:1328 length:492 start_codon:yes stop_codon:yes gene_type:complete